MDQVSSNNSINELQQAFENENLNDSASSIWYKITSKFRSLYKKPLMVITLIILCVLFVGYLVVGRFKVNHSEEWTTYSSTRSGIKFKYPSSDFEVKNTTDISLNLQTSDAKAGFVFSAYGMDENIDLDTFLSDPKYGYSNESPFMQKKKISKDKYPALQLILNENPNNSQYYKHELLINRGKFILSLRLVSNSKNELEKRKELFEKIISTIQFSETAEEYCYPRCTVQGQIRWSCVAECDKNYSP